ncbi:MAG TPA: PilZ domain-containing protein [Candidatus Angelobacter sp.]|nr:PilZ domain-containing protein [Candidatus Angelobacter sp.]
MTGAKTSTNERRILPRFALQLPLVLTLPETERRFKGKTKDISAGGIFFFSDAPVAEQQEIEILMTLPPEVSSAEIKVACRAKILRLEKDRNGFGVGIAAAIQSFDYLTDRKAIELHAYGH